MKTIHALRIDVCGAMSRVTLQVPDVDPLSAVRAQIGQGCCAAELVDLGHLDMWVDENGLVYEPTVNGVATVFAKAFGAPVAVLVGHAVVTGRTVTDDGPELGSIPEHFFDVLGI